MVLTQRRQGAKFFVYFFFAIFAALRETIFTPSRFVLNVAANLTAARFRLTIHTDFEY